MDNSTQLGPETRAGEPPEKRGQAMHPADDADGVRDGLPEAHAHPWNGRRHVLDLDDFSRAEIEVVLENADRMREILSRRMRRVPALRGRSVVNLFYEASTRTRVSFEVAAKNLGADVINVAASGSSVEKGETLLDTVRTLTALGAEILVVRHQDSGAPYTVAQLGDISVINAGDGTHAHPTQALLDAYTIRERFGKVDGLRVLIVGDIAHSRVARSDAWGLSKLGAQVILCGPPTLLPPTLTQPRAPGSDLPWPVAVEYDLEEAMRGADVVMPLRIQLERQEGNRLSSLREYVRDYAITRARLQRAASHAIVMHPGPMNEGVEIDPDVAHGERSVVLAQVTNGVAVRMAVLYMLVAAASARGRSATNPPAAQSTMGSADDIASGEIPGTSLQSADVSDSEDISDPRAGSRLATTGARP